ncbi:putative dna-directed rna polymerase ii subunit rpb1 protein [Neofusicoccum parvum UCRNP2]|uniref:Putative dna-directed rna polymerase ii subunit rpb1 protein n=1 Tax=Botryosphaeria parva (strain UCR-NP2) TaxID=1287680 RepID=R1GFM3_BOTPV|nr:putative dna-directed rna polymerase ii subunit rpb1 protein [Neofusicoccum parvum UCRNP2]
MAMVSHTQAVTTITPPASAHGDRSSWDFAVPISPENATYDHYISNDLAGKTYSPRQPLSGQPNGYPRSSQRRTDTLDSQRSGKSGYADAHLAASRVDAIARKPSGHSEADSLLDMYKNGDKRRAPNGAVANGAEETERNNNYWIHRDKLAQIERHELEEAGYQRKRGGSVGSQVLLDDASDLGSSNDGDVNSKKNSPKSGSPGKAKMPSNKGPNSGKRTTSKSRTGSQGQNKSRTNSGTTARPRTASRPTTARPEGEAPWIATMYKPDPRLPPDQQMLPTHAKRIAQEQWEKEGKVGNVYDKDFKLLNDHDYSAKRRSTGSMSPVYQDPVPEQPQQEAQPVQQVQSRPVDEEVQREEQPRSNWPLDSSEKVEQNGRPQTAKTEHAGYKTTPTLHTSPTIPNITTTVTAPHSPKPETIRVPDPGEKEDEKPKKSACCCVVM